MPRLRAAPFVPGAAAVKIALATCSEFPELDEDDRALLPALAAAGAQATPLVWDDPFADWAAHDLVVVRNTWDYVGRRDEFLAWARGVERLINPPDVLEWSTDKRYLGELREARLPVVPTMFVEPGTRFPMLEGEVVVKPVESAGARTPCASSPTRRRMRVGSPRASTRADAP